MAVATGVRHGDQGQVLITTGQPFAVFAVQVTRWEASWDNEYFNQDVFAGTNKGHLNYRGMYDVTGTFEGYFDGRSFVTASFDPGAAASAKLYLVERSPTLITSGTPHPSGSVVLEGNAHINLRLSVNRATGLNSYTATFKSDGDWTETLTA